MGADYCIIGHFDNPSTATAAISMLRKEGHEDDMSYYSPFPDHHLEDAQYQGKKRSPVRRFTLLGGLTGCLGAFLFTSWMSIDYPIRVSAKPLVSVPAFIIIAFECTILLGALFTLLSMFHFSRIPGFRRPSTYRPVFSEGTFGVVICAEKEKGDALKNRLMELGAREVEAQYAG